jgi:hypothetical protein
MRRIARLVTICMLLIGIPAKGTLAATMLCGSGHEGITTTFVAQPFVAHHHDHAADEDASNVGGEADDNATSAGHPLFAAHGISKCSTCATCCVGGAFLISPEVMVPPSVGTEAPFPALDIDLPGIVVRALERPPRTFLV